MLDKEEELRLASILDVCNEGKSTVIEPDIIRISTVLWLAEKLKEANDRLKGLCPHGYEWGDHHWFQCMNVIPFKEKVEVPNPLTVQYKGTTRIVAIWEDGKYVCTWCGVWFTQTESAKSHGFKHLRVKDPEDDSNCNTLPDGSCNSDKPCMHDPRS